MTIEDDYEDYDCDYDYDYAGGRDISGDDYDCEDDCY